MAAVSAIPESGSSARSYGPWRARLIRNHSRPFAVSGY